MRLELARLHRIECHLLGQPQPADAPAWEVQVLLDAELAADAATQQQLYEGLRLAGRRQLRQELATIHHRLYGSAPAGWWASLAGRLRPVLRPWLRRKG